MTRCDARTWTKVSTQEEERAERLVMKLCYAHNNGEGEMRPHKMFKGEFKEVGGEKRIYRAAACRDCASGKGPLPAVSVLAKQVEDLDKKLKLQGKENELLRQKYRRLEDYLEKFILSAGERLGFEVGEDGEVALA